jgi:hypothetical protein
MDEIWKEHKKLKNLYISNNGNIKFNDNLLKKYIKNDYEYIYFAKKHYRVHILVYETFYDKDLNKIINHINGIKKDNRLLNLEQISHSENIKHAINNNLLKIKSKKINMFDKNKNFIKTYNSIKEAACENNLDSGSITKVCKKILKTTGGFYFEYDNNLPLEKNNTYNYTVINNYPNYGATIDGKIINIKKNKELSYSYVDGYKRVSITNNENKRKSLLVHRLIAETYIENPTKKVYVNHINKIKHDNKIQNLEWVTASENNFHKCNFQATLSNCGKVLIK